MPSSPSTPVKTMTNADNTTTPTRSRKSPTCTKCKQPKLGHARKGCPNVDDLVLATQRIKITSQLVNDDHEEKSLRRPSMTPKLVSQPTLRSLSSTSSMIVNRLLEPGIMSDQSGEEDEAKGRDVIQWTENKKVFIKQGNTDVPFQSIPEEGIFLSSSTSVDETIPSPRSSQNADQPQCLVRTMSEEQREMFIAGLYHSKASLAFAVLIPKADLPAVVKDAENHGFFTDANSDGLLIVGRDRAEVKQLRQQVGGGKGTFIKGMFAGSVLMFTGLACS